MKFVQVALHVTKTLVLFFKLFFYFLACRTDICIRAESNVRLFLKIIERCYRLSYNLIFYAIKEKRLRT